MNICVDAFVYSHILEAPLIHVYFLVEKS